MKKKYTIAETFVGAGGSLVGFEQAGFKSIYVNDFDEEFLQTLIINNPKLEKEAFIDSRSIVDVDGQSILKKTNLKKGELDVLFGGIVCKGFSLAGDRSPNDERSYYYQKQLDLVKELQPKISVIENVVGILNGRVLKKGTPKKIKEEVDALWKEIANFKGKKADLTKTGKIKKEFEEYGDKLKNKRKEIIDNLEKKGYMVPVVKDIYDIYNSLGYKVQHKTLNAAWYGAATKRERVVIVAVRNDIKEDFHYPLPIYYSDNLRTKLDFDKNDINKIKFKKPITVNDALATIDYNNKNDLDNQPMQHNTKTVERFRYIPEGDSIANHLNKLPKGLLISKFYSRGNTMRLSGKTPSPTLVPGHSNFPVHPRENRSISVREAATITGFPINYKFVGNHTKRCEQVGNAVPPPLAKAIGEECRKLLNKYYHKNS
ncbi:DNA cytosine methyltransferase [bacterium]|nr:DNA cytosine methyltransferase [bacterium]